MTRFDGVAVVVEARRGHRRFELLDLAPRARRCAPSRSAIRLLQRFERRAASCAARPRRAFAASRDRRPGLAASPASAGFGRGAGASRPSGCFGLWVPVWDLGLGTWRAGRCLRVLLAPQELRVGARIDDRFAVADLDDLRRQLLDEVAIVRHDDRASRRSPRAPRGARPSSRDRGGWSARRAAACSTAAAACAPPRAACARRPTARPPSCRRRRRRRGSRRGCCGWPGTMSFGEPACERLVDGQRRVEAGRLVLREVLHHHLVAERARARCRAPPRPTASASASTCRRRWARPARCGRRARCAGSDP